jgi:hypothetical protein
MSAATPIGRSAARLLLRSTPVVALCVVALVWVSAAPASRRAIVVAFHPLAADAGVRMLNQ